MDEASQRLKQRLTTILRAERAFGGSGFPARAMGEAVLNVQSPIVVEQAAAKPTLPTAVPAAQMRPTPPAAIEAQPALIADAPAGVEFGPHRPPFDSPVLAAAEKARTLAVLDETQVKGCIKCILCKTRTNTVFGEGDPDARLMFIGEGPGENEDLQGRPFVGKAGELLNKMINGMGLRREQVYIANIVKCRPPGNRVPAPDEVATCTPYLEQQIEVIRPQVIVTLGLPSTQYMLQSKLAMGKMRGQWHTWRGIKLMPTYHPAYVLRSYTEQTRAAVWSDLQQVMKELGLELKRKPRADS